MGLKEDRIALYVIIFALFGGILINYCRTENYQPGLTDEEKQEPEAKYFNATMPKISANLEKNLNGNSDC